MLCRKCSRELPDGAVFCCWCGIKQALKPTGTKRANGAGWARRRQKTWTAGVTLGYADGVPDTVTLGGFPTKSSAIEFVPVLKAAKRILPSERNAVLRNAKKCSTIDEALYVVKSYKRKLVEDEATFKDIYDRWYPFYEPRIDKSTMAGHRAALAYFGDILHIPFASLSAEDLQDCVDACQKGRRTKENMKSLCKRLYEYAIGRKITTVNCADYIYIPRDGNHRRDALKPEHVEKIRQQIGLFPLADYVYCLCYLGFRPNEMLRLDKSAYHQEGQVEYLIGGFKTASGTDRVVTIAPQIKDIIHNRLKAPGDLLFPGPDGEQIDDEYLREKVFYPLLDHLGIQSIPETGKPAQYVPYSCRHYFSNLLKDAKGADKDKAALMGHSDYETTKRVYQSENLEAMQRITNSFQ